MLDKKDFSDTLLTLQEVQEIFRCGKRQTYELLHIPGFPAMKLGGNISSAPKPWITGYRKTQGKR